MNRRQFIRSICVTLAGNAALILTGGCVAPRISPTVSKHKSQAWQCENCGHLTRSEQNLIDNQCPRCMHKGFMMKITEKELQEHLE